MNTRSIHKNNNKRSSKHQHKNNYNKTKKINKCNKKLQNKKDLLINPIQKILRKQKKSFKIFNNIKNLFRNISNNKIKACKENKPRYKTI